MRLLGCRISKQIPFSTIPRMNYVDKLASTGLSVRQATKLVNQVTKICDQFVSQLRQQSVTNSQWIDTDKKYLYQSLRSIRDLFVAEPVESSQLKNIDRHQLEQIEHNLKDDFNAIKSAVQLDISLEQRRNDCNAQEIQRICRECIAYASLQSQDAKKRLERVEKSATTAICAFSALLASSFLGYCLFFKEY